MLNDEILQQLAHKHNLPEEQIELIIKSFYNGLRHYLSNPLESKSGIMIHDLITFKINVNRLKKEIERIESKGHEYTQTRSLTNNNLEFHKKLLDNTSKYERQEKKPDIHKRFSS